MTAAEGRKFAFTVGAAFLVLGAFVWWRDFPLLTRIFVGLGIALGLLGTFVPAKLGPVQAAWMGLALLISKVTTPIFMGLVFFLAITPIGLLMRLFGKRPMQSKPGATYWHTREPGARQGDLTRQF